MSDFFENKYVRLLAISCVLSVVAIEWALSKMRPLRATTEEHRLRDTKFAPFKRNDTNKVNRLVLYAAAPFLFIRFFTGWMAIVV